MSKVFRQYPPGFTQIYLDLFPPNKGVKWEIILRCFWGNILRASNLVPVTTAILSSEFEFRPVSLLRIQF